MTFLLYNKLKALMLTYKTATFVTLINITLWLRENYLFIVLQYNGNTSPVHPATLLYIYNCS